MQTIQTDLTIIGAHTPDCRVFWKGQEVPNLGVSVSFDGKVVLRVAEDPTLADMQGAGIVIRRIKV